MDTTEFLTNIFPFVNSAAFVLCYLIGRWMSKKDAEDKVAQLEAENERLLTYAQLLEGRADVDVDRIRQSLGIKRILMEWIIPEEHRKALGGE